MKTYIVVSKKVYEKIKDEILPLNPRLFTHPYFYNLNEYEDPFDLKGIKSYLSYVEKVCIYTTTTFIDFVNILLVLSFFKRNNYKNEVEIKYVFETSQRIDMTLKKNSYDDVDEILDLIKNQKQIKGKTVDVVGFINYVNFYNMIIDSDKFLLALSEVIEKYDEDIDLIASYLQEKYSIMGLNKEFYLDYLKKYM